MSGKPKIMVPLQRAAAYVGLFLLCGCATTDRQATILYQPTVNYTGGNGELLLTLDGKPSDMGQGPWTLGAVRNNHREKVANIVSGVPPDRLMLDAFASELRSAGYRVVQATEIAADASKGVRLANVGVTVDEIDGLFSAETHTMMKVTVELWRSGVKLKKMDYETDYTNSAVANRSSLAADSLQDALSNFLKQAVPAIVKNLE